MEASNKPALEGFERTLATLAVLLAAFMNVLDSTIAVVALPSIAGALSATPSQGSWVLTTYSVSLAVVLPLAGWIAKRFGQVRAFSLAVFFFTLTSWLCAAATSFDELLVYRALQGASGGMLLPFSQSIMLRIFPPEQHGKALGLWGLSAAVGPVAGPLLGGVITDNLGWPWIFYINIPLGIFSLWVLWSIMRHHETEIVRNPIDIVGLVLLVVAVMSLQLALDRGHELDWFSSPIVQVLALTGVTALILFFVWERDLEHPIVDLSLFRVSSFAIGSIMTALFYATFIISAVLYPLWMQTTLGYTPFAAGLVMATTSIFPIISMPFIGQWLRHRDPRWVISSGCLFLAYVLWLHGAMTVQVSSTYLTTVRFMIGLTMPLLWMPLTMITLVGLPPEKIDTATGLSNFMRMLVSSLATAIGVTMWDDRSIVHRANLVDAVSEYSVERSMALSNMNASGEPGSGLSMLEAMISQQARTMAQQDVYVMCMGVIAIVLVLAWLLPDRMPTGAKTGVVVD